MTRFENFIRNLSTTDLVELFTKNSVEQGEEIKYGSIKIYNALFSKNCAILEELRSRDTDRRRDLIKLYEHDNVQVRLNAARATRLIDPHRARQVIEAIAASGDMPYAGDAGMDLYAWDEGIWKAD